MAMFQLKVFGEWKDVDLPFADLAAFNAQANRVARNEFLTSLLLSNWGWTTALCRKLRGGYYFRTARVRPTVYGVDPVTDGVFTARLSFEYAEDRGRGMKVENHGSIEMKLMGAAPEKA